MRKLTKHEEALLRKIVSIYKSSSANNVPELQVAKIIRNELDFFAIKWETNHKPQVTIYKPKSHNLSDAEVDKIYFQIADFIYFLEELEKANFIKLQNIPSENQEDYTILYDRDKYIYNNSDNSFWQNMPNVDFQGNSYTVKAIVSLEGWKTFYTDFANDLDKYGMTIIYPLPLLVDFVENDFKTLEQRQFDEELQTAKETLKETKNTLKATQKAFIVTLLTLLATVGIGVWQKYSQQGIDSEQINSVVSAIKEHKTVTIDSVKTLPNDTFNVNIIQPKAKPALKPQQNPLEQPILKN